MTDQLHYVRDKLATARNTRGQIAKISREVETDRRTVLSVLDVKHSPNPATLDKLLAYFKREDRKAERAAK